MSTVTSAITSTTIATPLSHIPLRRDADEQPSLASWGVVVSVLLLGLILMVLLQYLRRRQQTPIGGVSKLRVTHTHRLNPTSSLHVVEWAGQELLLSSTQSEVRVLHQHPGHPLGSASGETSA